MDKILLIDDHAVVRSGIRILLEEEYKPASIHEAMDGFSARQKLTEYDYELILLDIQVPDTDTLALMNDIYHNYPHTKVLVFSMSPENIFASRYLKAGARGFVSKMAPLEEITSAINIILQGNIYISETLAEKLLEEEKGEINRNPFDSLSPREFEIVMLLLKGKTVSDISHLLNIQISTVGTHKSRTFEKLHVQNLLDLKDLANVFQV